MLQKLRGACRPYIGTRSFYHNALLVMIPVAVQQLINTLFNVVDNLMVGSLDVLGLAMSGVTVANKPYTVFCSVFFGMTGAAGLMISQYYGSKDHKTCQGLFSLQMALGLSASFLFFLLLKLWPRQIMEIFVTDERTIDLGMRYMAIICYSYLPAAISNVCIFSMRALGQNRWPMLVSLTTMGVNAVCNYILIFGMLGVPAMGVEGAAYGTVIARIVEMSVYLTLLLRKRMYFTIDMSAFTHLSKRIVKSFRQKAIPLITNEVFWSLGLNVFFWCYAKLDEASLPAITIAEQCSLFAAVMAAGASSAVSVMIGTELGANRLKEAKANCKKLFTLDIAISLVGMVLCCGLGVVMPLAYHLSPELQRTATMITLIMGVLCPFQFIYGFCFFCLRAGGDTRNAMLLDSGYLWVLPVPAAVLIALFLPGKISLPLAVLIIQFLMYAKVVLALWVLRKGHWIRNITLEESESASC
ncbi:MAG: MATE family efflux transporter [Eubacteriales bacterium]|nr:MATE family efflux transporter [Eubacteriales bacterium]